MLQTDVLAVRNRVTKPDSGFAVGLRLSARAAAELLEGEQRDVSTFDITRAWRQRIGKVPEAEAVWPATAVETYVTLLESR